MAPTAGSGRRLAWLAGTAVAVAFAGTLAAQSPASRKVPDHHYVPLARPGEGGHLLVTAGVDLCADRALELVVRRNLTDRAAFQYVGRRPLVPACHWEFPELLPGLYDATIQTKEDQRIVATGQVELVRGGTGLIRLEPLYVELQGQLTVGGIAASADYRLTFKGVSAIPPLEWDAPVDTEGVYHVKVAASGTLCAWVFRRVPMNPVVKCDTFLPGFRRFDIDIPPGVIRVRLQAVDAARVDAPVLLSVGKPGMSSTSSPHLKEPFRGDFFGHGYGTYSVRVQTMRERTTLAAVDVTLSPKEPEASVSLVVTVPPS